MSSTLRNGTIRNGQLATKSILDFSPELFLDGSDLSTITKDGSDLVSNWADKSVHGRDAIQNNASFKFTYTPASINGESALVGTSDFMVTSLNIDPATNPVVTLVFAYEWNDLGNAYLYGNDNGGFDRFGVLKSASAPNGGISDGGGSVAVPGLGIASTVQVAWIEIQDGVGSGSKVYINKVLNTTFTENNAAPGATSTAIGAINLAGATAFSGKFGTVLAFFRILSEIDRRWLTNKLINKWGIT